MATTHLAVLPTDALNTPLDLPSGSSRFLRLPHPRTGLPSLFLPYSLPNERDAILEVQAVSPANPRTWFVGQEVVADGKLLVMTPIDPAFLLIPILQAVYPENGDQGMFRPEDEVFEDAASNLEETSVSAAQDSTLLVSKDDVMRFTSLRCCQPALKRICDVKEITEEITVYRFSAEKTVAYLRTKVERLSTPETTELSRTLVRNLAKDGLMEDGREELLKVGRIRAACDLVAQYTPHGIRNLLLASYDFAPLDAYFKSIADENAAMAVEKPAKSKPTAKAATTDKKRKSGASQGVEKLKKVNTEGMAKLSTFFTKKVPG